MKQDASETYYFPVLSGNLARPPQCERTVLLRRKKKTVKVTLFCQSEVLQQPNVFKPKTLPPYWDHGGVGTGSWVGDFPGKQNSKIASPIMQLPCRGFHRPLKQVLLPKEGHSLFVCVKPRANGATGDSFSGILPFKLSVSGILLIYVFAQSLSFFWALCFNMMSKNRPVYPLQTSRPTLTYSFYTAYRLTPTHHKETYNLKLHGA